MIVKNRFSPRSMWPYARFELALGAGSGIAAWLLVDLGEIGWLALPATLAVVLGTAVSILLAVRVNTAYQRWWEASGIWAQITALSRNLARVVIAVTSSKLAAGADPVAVQSFQRAMVQGQVAYVVALRQQLRGQPDIDGAAGRLGADEADIVRTADNPPAMLLQLHSHRIFRAYTDGILTGLDNFQMEVALAALAQQQALAERTRMQPIPRVYDVFSRYLVHLYVIVFPFTIITGVPAYQWLVIPATVVVAFAFRMVERIGAVVEQPFAGTAQDVPLTAITTGIERDLLEQLGEVARPPAPVPVGGYLY